MLANARTTAPERPCLRMQNLRQATTGGKATANPAGQTQRGAVLTGGLNFGSQKFARAVSGTLGAKALQIAADGPRKEHINLWGGQAKQSRHNHELRWGIGANPGNAGVRPGATGLVSRRGVSVRRSAIQAQSHKRTVDVPRMRPGAVCRAVDRVSDFT
jgi:hypothetical protein